MTQVELGDQPKDRLGNIRAVFRSLTPVFYGLTTFSNRIFGQDRPKPESAKLPGISIEEEIFPFKDHQNIHFAKTTDGEILFVGRGIQLEIPIGKKQKPLVIKIKAEKISDSYKLIAFAIGDDLVKGGFYQRPSRENIVIYPTDNSDVLPGVQCLVTMLNRGDGTYSARMNGEPSTIRDQLNWQGFTSVTSGKPLVINNMEELQSLGVKFVFNPSNHTR